jgi:MFS transporter, ACS family, allantoate permease
MLVTRVYLSIENRRREREGHDATYDEVYIAQTREDGTKEDVKVDKVRFPAVYCTP